MQNYTIGQLINCKGGTRKVLGIHMPLPVAGENHETIYFLSKCDQHDRASRQVWTRADIEAEEVRELIFSEMIEVNWNNFVKKWPQIRDSYYFIIIDSAHCSTGESYWANDEIDKARRDFLGIYRTRQEAEAALERIKKALKNV